MIQAWSTDHRWGDRYTEVIGTQAEELWRIYVSVFLSVSLCMSVSVCLCVFDWRHGVMVDQRRLEFSLVSCSRFPLALDLFIVCVCARVCVCVCVCVYVCLLVYVFVFFVFVYGHLCVPTCICLCVYLWKSVCLCALDGSHRACVRVNRTPDRPT